MTKQNEIYKCNVCGNIVEVLHASGGTLVCCGMPMQKMDEWGWNSSWEKTSDQGLEKHVPVIEKTATGVKVKVGSIEHPMESSHYIEFIEVISDGRVYRKFLNPGDKPEAEFPIKAGKVEAREYCNLHGLWKA